MRILVANVNTTQSMTDSIAAQARSVAAPGDRDRRDHAAVRRGFLRGKLRKLPRRHRRDGRGGQLPGTVRRRHPGGLRRARPGGAAGAPGRARRRHHRGRRVHGHVPGPQILGGHHPGPGGAADRGPAEAGRASIARCASVRASGMAVLELEEEPERAVEAIIDQALARSVRTRPRSSCWAAAAWPGWTRRSGRRAGVPVVDGVAAAVTIAESLVRLGLSTSKVRTYATPRPKTVIGWPITAAAAHPRVSAPTAARPSTQGATMTATQPVPRPAGTGRRRHRGRVRDRQGGGAAHAGRRLPCGAGRPP